MKIDQYLADHLVNILEIARLAPSVHNTQPWLVSVDGDAIKIEADARHKLTYGDPTGRQITISLGIFSEAVCLAAEQLGLKAAKTSFQQERVFIHFEKTADKQQSNSELVRLLRQRHTDRSLYRPIALTEEFVKIIEHSHIGADVRVWATTDQAKIKKIATLTAQGISLALHSPDFRKELSHYLVLPWSKKKRGIAVRSLYIFWLLELFEPWLIKFGVGLRTEVRLEKKRWLSASGVIAITAAGDMPKFWFEAGRTYLRVSLTIEKFGLSQATSAAAIEASNYHEDIEELLGTNQRILAMIRVGNGSRKKYYSPRVKPNELLH